jgi:glycosyltransferase involved in cell wall biosynthesis
VTDVNVLFLTQVLPYPLAGGAKIRAYYVIRYLARNHNVTLVSFSRDDDRPEYIEHLEEHCDEVVTVPISRSRSQDIKALARSRISGVPAVIIRDWVENMAQTLRDVATRKQFDIVHADQTAMAQYAEYIKDISEKSNKPRIVLDQHNALFEVVRRQAKYESGWQKWLWNAEAKKLIKYEAGLIRHFDRILTVTEVDKIALLNLLGPLEKEQISPKLTAVPICVDPKDRRYLYRSDSAANIVFLGTMFWPPNIAGVIWFCRQVLPLISEQIPGVRFTVIGKNPPEEVQKLEEINDRPQSIRITGFVENPQPILAESAVFVVPLLAGGGMRVKIPDAWLWGLPIVSTTIGAEGIDTVPGQNILIADEAESFAQAVSSLITDRNLAESLSLSGRAWVEERYNWQSEYRKIGDIYQSLVDNSRTIPN